MKKLLVGVLLFAATFAFSQVHTYFTPDPTLQWDAPAIGDATQIVEWEVWRSTVPVMDTTSPDEFIAVTPLKEIGLFIPDDDQAHQYAVRTKVTEGSLVAIQGGFGPLFCTQLAPRPRAACGRWFRRRACGHH